MDSGLNLPVINFAKKTLEDFLTEIKTTESQNPNKKLFMYNDQGNQIIELSSIGTTLIRMTVLDNSGKKSQQYINHFLFNVKVVFE